MIQSRPAESTTTRIWVLIPCAGSGRRAVASGAALSLLPKQYQMLSGQAMVLTTVAAFLAVPQITQILLVVAPGDVFFQSLVVQAEVVDCGGPSRAVSVANGLAQLLSLGAQDVDWVLVHDAARCLITPEQITELILACQTDDVGGLLALELTDTLKTTVAGRVGSTLDRSDKWLAQTPQMFRLGLLRQALAQASEQVTDESSAIEALGLRPLLVPGSAQNFKVTYPEDFALAEAVLQMRKI